MTAKCVDETQGLRPELYVVQNCWPSDLLLIMVMIVL